MKIPKLEKKVWSESMSMKRVNTIETQTNVVKKAEQEILLNDQAPQLQRLRKEGLIAHLHTMKIRLQQGIPI
ncbi:unnamed protein product [Clavelina lepadiformis]|uniref:Uncharacterized protein n=1 Tax=Clavelina lepadiformis TaxID=159417 RepID=A0ABP0GYN3_CLALP